MLHHLTVEDGLLEARNDFVYKDSYGFIWISSLTGLNRYDGKAIKNYQPDFNNPNSLFGQNIQSPFFETGSGDLVFTTYKGINIYKRNFEKFEHFVVPDSLNSYYAFHLDPDEKLWFINNGIHIYTLDLNSYVFSKIDSFPNTVLRVRPRLDERGKIKQLWAFSYQKPGVTVMDYENNSFLLDTNITENTNFNFEFREILFDTQDECWMATNTGLFLYRTDSGELIDYSPQVSNSEINSIAFLHEDTLLVSVENEGVFFFNRKTKKYLTSITMDQSNRHSLSSDNINKIYVDDDGGIWLSIIGVGVDFFYPEKSKFDYFKLTGNAAENNLNILPNVSGIVEHANGEIWCATRSSGLFILNENNIRRLDASADNVDLHSNEINYVFKDTDERIWVHTWDGIDLWPLNGNHRFIDTDTLDFLFMYQLDDGRLLLSCFYGGIYEIKEMPDGSFKIAAVNEALLNTGFTSMWQSRDGLLYACTDVSSISVVDPDQGFVIVDVIQLQGESDAFYENTADSSIWVASSSGLVRISPKNNESRAVRFFTEKDGLPDRVVYGILPDRQNNLWLSTNRGLASFNLDDHTVRRFSIADGLPSLAYSPRTAVALNSGEMLFGSSQGITRFFPEKIIPLNIKARPTITRIRVNDVENSEMVKGKNGATSVSMVDELELPYEFNTLSFNFAALEYSDPENVNFKYKMEGLDDDWVESGSRNFARYPNIPFGKFEFKLMASNSDGFWSEPRSLKIVVTPPFTRSPLFYALMAILFCGVVFMVFYTRQKRREERRRLEEEKRRALEWERQRIARDVHDDLGSGLSALSLQTAMAQYKSSPEDLKEELEKISQSARDLSGKIREVIWTVSAKNDTFSNLISYLNQYALDLLENTTMDISVNLPEHIPDLSVMGEHRRTIFLAFKEALNNMVKHAQASKVDIHFRTTENRLEIEVGDDGIGFDPKLLEASTGNGLLNMRTRMREIGGDCHFYTGEAGTRVVFSLLIN
ncbi:MAG: triple tyrosine motif-containing protein [Bacteroidota bacterium]